MTARKLDDIGTELIASNSPQPLRPHELIIAANNRRTWVKGISQASHARPIKVR
jgi:hypothetical protein